AQSRTVMPSGVPAGLGTLPGPGAGGRSERLTGGSPPEPSPPEPGAPPVATPPVPNAPPVLGAPPVTPAPPVASPPVPTPPPLPPAPPVLAPTPPVAAPPAPTTPPEPSLGVVPVPEHAAVRAKESEPASQPRCLGNKCASVVVRAQACRRPYAAASTPRNSASLSRAERCSGITRSRACR